MSIPKDKDEIKNVAAIEPAWCCGSMQVAPLAKSVSVAYFVEQEFKGNWMRRWVVEGVAAIGLYQAFGGASGLSDTVQWNTLIGACVLAWGGLKGLEQAVQSVLRHSANREIERALTQMGRELVQHLPAQEWDIVLSALNHPNRYWDKGNIDPQQKAALRWIGVGLWEIIQELTGKRESSSFVNRVQVRTKKASAFEHLVYACAKGWAQLKGKSNKEDGVFEDDARPEVISTQKVYAPKLCRLLEYLLQAVDRDLPSVQAHRERGQIEGVIGAVQKANPVGERKRKVCRL